MDRRLGPVRASTPAATVYARVLRMLTSNVAATAGLGYDRVDDVALATDEAFGQLLRLPGAEAITCTASCSERSVEVTLSVTRAVDSVDRPARWPDALADRVLAGATDSVEYSSEDGSIRFHVGAG